MPPLHDASLNELTRAFVDGAVDAAAVVDADLRVLHFNGAYAQLAGLRRRDLRTGTWIGMCHSSFHLTSCQEGPCMARRALTCGRPIRADEVKDTTGKLCFIVTAIPLLGAAGEPPTVVEIYRDVTAESRMQGRYRELLDGERRRSETLEESVRERTLALEALVVELTKTRAQLVHSEKMSSLGRMIAGIAHELNNPVNFIYANVDFIDGGTQRIVAASRMGELERRAEIDEASTELREILRAVQAGAQRIADLIRTLREYSHAGHSTKLDCDVLEQLRIALRLVSVHKRPSMRLLADLAPVPVVRGNAAQLCQVFTNLLLNALDAVSDVGTVHVTTRALPSGHVEIAVRDDGAGMDESTLGQIFEPFFTTKEIGKGTGLGLWLSFEIVKAHGGSIDVSSEPRVGSTFRVRLPGACPERE